MRLAIYDARGQLVRVLAEGRWAAGRHEVRWEGVDRVGRRVAPGVYFYQLKMAEARLSRRMVLLR